MCWPALFGGMALTGARITVLHRARVQDLTLASGSVWFWLVLTGCGAPPVALTLWFRMANTLFAPIWSVSARHAEKRILGIKCTNPMTVP